MRVAKIKLLILLAFLCGYWLQMMQKIDVATIATESPVFGGF
jgi:hypothetical protein